jgi:iron complex outermembrane receptor protein
MKKTKLLIFIIVAITILNNTIFSQNIIRGVLTDQTNKEILSFANVYLPDHNKGTLTNINGEFVIKSIPNGKTKIQFSYMGYKTLIKTLILQNTDTSINIEMEPTIFQAEEVVVSGGSYSTQHKNAIKIDVIKSKEIESAGSPGFIERLAKVPGVDLISKGSGVAKPVIRGLSMTNILMLNNGVKLENFQFSENHPFLIDEFGIDRVEIIKGPASLLYGSDAVGGVINVIKEKPAPEGTIEGDCNIQYFSNTEGIVSNLGVKGSSENIFWAFRAGIKSHADYKDGNGDYVPNTRFNEKSFKAMLGFNKNFGLFKLYYDYNRPKLGMCVGDAVLLTTENDRKNKVWYQDLTNHIISSRNTLFLSRYKVEINAAFQMNNRRLQTDDNKPAFEMVDMDLHTLSYEIKTNLPSDMNSEFIVGLQGAVKTNRNNEAPNHVLPDADLNDFSIFGLAEYDIIEELKAQAGVRYDFRSISTEMVDSDYGNISGSLGATYKINNKLLLRVNVASAYRTPNLAELTQDGWHGARYEQGNTDLKSQRSYEGDISAHYHSKSLMVDISGFYNRINDYIFISPTDDTISGGNTIYRYSQCNASIYGAEFVFNILPVKFIVIKSSYSYLIGKQDNDEYLPFIPQNKLRLEVKFQKEEIGIFKKPYAKVDILYAAKQNHPAMFETESDSYYLLGFGIGADFKWAKQMLSLSVRANNMLNETYIDHLSTLKGLGYKNIGRNISINLKIPFGIK